MQITTTQDIHTDSPRADCCMNCGLLIDSSLQCKNQDVDLCARCAKIDRDEEER